MSNWNEIKFNFLEFIIINNIFCFRDFYEKLKSEDKQIKGDYFEYFCKLYFTLEPFYKQKYKKFLLYTEIPSKTKEKYNLPKKDKGIDAIVYDNDDRVYAVQIKYRKYIDNSILFGELSTFPALTFGSKVKNIYKGIFFTNCIDVCEELKDDKFINIVYTCFDKCDNLFWTNVREYIGDKKITEYVPMKPLKKRLV